MFGHRHRPPKPPDHEPLILVLIAVLIATVLTVGYAIIMVMVQRAQTVGMP